MKELDAACPYQPTDMDFDGANRSTSAVDQGQRWDQMDIPFTSNGYAPVGIALKRPAFAAE